MGYFCMCRWFEGGREKKKIELCGGGGFPVRGEMENESRKRGAAPKVVGVICCR